MKLNRTPNPLDRNAKNGENDNWEKIEGSIKRIDDTVSDLILESGGDSNLEVVQARGGKPVLNDRLNSIETELAEEALQRKNKDDELENRKADTSYVNNKLNDISVTQINKNKGKLDASYMSEEFLQQIAGNTPIGNVPEDGSVTPEKTTFSRTSRNLFDKERAKLGKRLINGIEENDPGWFVSDFIPVKVGQTIAKSHSASLGIYDIDKNLLSSYGSNPQSYPIVAGGAYIKVSSFISNLEDFQVELGDSFTKYEEYGKVFIDDLVVGKKSIEPSITSTINNNLTQERHKSLIKLEDYPNHITNLLDNSFTISTISASYKIDDSINWRGDTFKINCDGNDMGHIILIPKEVINISPASAVGMWVFIPDLTNITDIALDIYHNSSLNPYWTRRAQNIVDFELKEGWNLLRWDASAGVIGDWEEIHRIRVRVINNGKTEINIGSIFLENREKASLILVNDGGRRTWLNVAYPELKMRGIPTTWAIIPNSFGSHEDSMSEEEVLSLMYDLESSFSFHSFGSGTPTAQMNERETREDALRCIRYLKSKGLASDYLWRAAVHQNNAPYHRVNDDLLLASATHTNHTGGSPLAFPFTKPYDIPRLILHTLTNETTDSVFESMKKTRGVVIAYTHGIFDNPQSADMSTAQWEYFLTKLDEALSEGWLEGTTFEGLYGQIANNINVNGLEQLKLATRI